MKSKITQLVARSKERGQIALVMLLIMIVMLTLGMAVAQRGISDVKISRQEEETSRAFQAAEAGIEKGLTTLTAGTGGVAADTNFKLTVEEEGGAGWITPQDVDPGETIAVNLTGANSNAMVDIYFFDTNTDCGNEKDDWGLEFTLVRKVNGETKIEKDLVLVAGAKKSKSTLGRFPFQGTTFCRLLADIQVGAGADEIRLRPVGRPTKIGVKPSGNIQLPPQYHLLKSEGKTDSGVVRVVQVKRDIPHLPTLFDYVLLSGGNLIKYRRNFAPRQDETPGVLSVNMVSSIPANGETWPGLPVNVAIEFDGDIDPASTMTITNGGEDYSQGDAVVDDSDRVLRQTLEFGSPNGLYNVAYHICDLNGACGEGQFNFTVDPALFGQMGFVDLRDRNGRRNATPILFTAQGATPSAAVALLNVDVTWTNKEDKDHKVAGEYHPLHYFYPGLISPVIKRSVSYRFKFTEPGLYVYHIDSFDGTPPQKMWILAR